MKEATYEKFANQIIEIIKNCEFCKAEKITLKTKIIDTVNPSSSSYNILIGNIEEYFSIDFPDEKIIYKIYYTRTVKNLVDYILEIIKEKYKEIEISENEIINKGEEKIDKLIEIIERTVKETKLNETALKKIRWSEEDKKLSKHPLD